MEKFSGKLFHTVILIGIHAICITVNGAPLSLDLQAYGAIHSRMPSIIMARSSGAACGNWYAPYSIMHGSVRLGTLTPPKYSVMVSVESGLADRLGASLTVFLYSILANRTFEYMWYGHHDLWESYQSPWIDWRVPIHEPTLAAVKVGASGPSLDIRDTDGTAGMSTENHHWSQPHRSFKSAKFYLEWNDPEKQQIRDLFGYGDPASYAKDFDIVLWTLNIGILHGAFRNRNLADKLREMGLTWQTVVPCLFNYLYVPSPAALAPFANSALLDKLLDPNHEIVGIQVRVGDWVFERQGAQGASSVFEDSQFLARSEAHFHCAEQLTNELAAQISEGPSRRVFWFLISDSAALRAAAMRRYGRDGRLLVAEGVALDHVQDHPFHRQDGLHVAASEMWLFGLATAHVVTQASAFGRLGALAGGPWLRRPGAPMHRVYGIYQGQRRCSLSQPDSLDDIASWWTMLRRQRRTARRHV